MTRLTILLAWFSLACSTAAPGPSLLLAYPGHEAGPGATPTRVRVVTSPDGLAWTDAEFPEVPSEPAAIRGVGAAAHETAGLERVVAWVAGGSDTFFRYALGTSWESTTGVQHNHITGSSGDPESTVYDSPPSLVHLKEGTWVVLQRTDGAVQALLYNQSSAAATLLPGVVPAGVMVRHRPVIARDASTFVVALGSIGTTGTPPLQMVSGKITAAGLEPASGLLTPIRQGTQGAPDPVVTRPDTSNQRFFVTTDVCLAADGHGKFLLGFVESAARVDAVATQTLVPTTGEQKVKVFTGEGSTFPTAGSTTTQIAWIPWATIPLTGEQGGHPLYVQCAFKPATSREAIVFVTGGDVGGARGFALVPPQTGHPVYQSLPPATLTAAFALVPSQGAFSLIQIGATAAF